MMVLSADGDVYVPELDVKEEKDEVVDDEPPLTAWNTASVGQRWSLTTTMPCNTPSSSPAAPPSTWLLWSPPPPTP
jgi:hypothetical protein